MIVFGFDRDSTVNSSEAPGPIPLDWVIWLARETPHEVWAIGNQKLKAEASIPGLDKLRERLGITKKKGGAALKDKNNRLDRRAANVKGKHKRLRLLQQAFPEAKRYICVDDFGEVAHVGAPWEYFTPQAFVDYWPELEASLT